MLLASHVLLAAQEDEVQGASQVQLACLLASLLEERLAFSLEGACPSASLQQAAVFLLVQAGVASSLQGTWHRLGLRLEEEANSTGTPQAGLVASCLLLLVAWRSLLCLSLPVSLLPGAKSSTACANLA